MSKFFFHHSESYSVYSNCLFEFPLLRSCKHKKYWPTKISVFVRLRAFICVHIRLFCSIPDWLASWSPESNVTRVIRIRLSGLGVAKHSVQCLMVNCLQAYTTIALIEVICHDTNNCLPLCKYLNQNHYIFMIL